MPAMLQLFHLQARDCIHQVATVMGGTGVELLHLTPPENIRGRMLGCTPPRPQSALVEFVTSTQ